MRESVCECARIDQYLHTPFELRVVKMCAHIQEQWVLGHCANRWRSAQTRWRIQGDCPSEPTVPRPSLRALIVHGVYHFQWSAGCTNRCLNVLHIMQSLLLLPSYLWM